MRNPYFWPKYLSQRLVFNFTLSKRSVLLPASSVRAVLEPPFVIFPNRNGYHCPLFFNQTIIWHSLKIWAGINHTNIGWSLTSICYLQIKYKIITLSLTPPPLNQKVKEFCLSTFWQRYSLTLKLVFHFTESLTIHSFHKYFTHSFQKTNTVSN